MYHVADPERSHTQSGNGYNQADNRYPFVPCGIGQFQMMLVRTCSVKNLTDYTEDIDCRNHDRGTSDDRYRAVEYIVVHERTVKDSHLGNKTAQSRQT